MVRKSSVHLLNRLTRLLSRRDCRLAVRALIGIIVRTVDPFMQAFSVEDVRALDGDNARVCIIHGNPRLADGAKSSTSCCASIARRAMLVYGPYTYSTTSAVGSYSRHFMFVSDSSCML